MKKFIFAALFLPLLVMGRDILLIENGKSNAGILYSMQNDNSKTNVIFCVSAKQSAERLSAYIQKSTKVKLPVAEAGKAGKFSPSIELRIAAPGTMDDQGFTITFPGSSRIVITGGSSRGLQYGCSEFLERYFGVRWLFPGELGTEIPAHKTVRIPAVNISEKPDFRTRILHGGNHTQKAVADYYRWSLDNRGTLGVRTNFNSMHNMLHLVSVKKYGSTHPEFFPVQQGKRKIPDGPIFWQPCFTTPHLAETVVQSIPKTGTVSLVVNDGGEHCECEQCRKIDGCGKNMLGFPNRTKSYILFCNQLAKMRPDVHFTISAYADVTECPGIKLEKNIHVGITYETIQMLEPTQNVRICEHVRRWRDCSTADLGWYDYLYGSTYCLPRVFPRTLAWRMKWMYQNRVRHATGEYYPNGNWQDALKVYIWQKVLWNVNTDVDALIDDWCRAAVGLKASPYFQAYFDRLEKFWTSDALRRTPWFKHEYIYLNASDSSFLDAMPLEMIDECERLLVKTHELSTNKARSGYFLNAFRKSKPTLILYKKNQRLREQGAKMNFDKVVYQSNLNKGKDTWYIWQEWKERGKSVYAPNGGRNGGGSLVIDMNGSRLLSNCWKHQTPVQPCGVYRITVWCREVKVNPGAKISLWAGYKKNNKWMDFSLRTDASFVVNEQQGKWRKIVFYSSAPNVPDARLVLVLGGSNSQIGHVYFDDVKIETCTNPASVL